MKNLANVVGAKTARACDSCVKRRARWYCAADDAFLCQSCDVLVHSANPLARRHERVRLKSSASSPSATKPPSPPPPPPHESSTWHHGFTRKPRTPRGSNKKSQDPCMFHDLVPEINNSLDDHIIDGYEMHEEQLICQVPVLDPMVALEFLNDVVAEPKIEFPLMRSCGVVMMDDDQEDNEEISCLNGFFPTDMELEEFAADVETLLGHGLDTDSSELGLLTNSEMFKIEKDYIIDDEEEEERKEINKEVFDDDRKDVDGTVPFGISFDYELSPHKACKELEVIKNVEISSSRSGGGCIKVKEEEQKNVLKLRLNYDSVISTWGGQSPPWLSGEPPKLDVDINTWPADVPTGVINGREISHKKQYLSGYITSSSGYGDGGREARVSRYKEKRRTRLFSKKIRYEVRKLNAEKRPRMKGRFVKRTSLDVSSSVSPLCGNY